MSIEQGYDNNDVFLQPDGLVVVKLSGSLLVEGEGRDELIDQLAALIERCDGRVVVVHGGGEQIDDRLASLGLHAFKVDGIRSTPVAHMVHVAEVLAGRLNTELVAGLNARGVRAIGLTLCDGKMVEAQVQEELGRVGRVQAVDPSLIEHLFEGGFVPIACSVGCDDAGGLVNINADEATLHLAGGVGASLVVMLTRTPGVLNDDGMTIADIDAETAEQLIDSGLIHSGMVAKVRAAIEIVTQTGAEVVITNQLADINKHNATVISLASSRQRRKAETLRQSLPDVSASAN